MDFTNVSEVNKAAAATDGRASNRGPLPVFFLGVSKIIVPHLVLFDADAATGAPCSGKSTLCAALAKRYSLDHYAFGDEHRSLVSDIPSGYAGRVKALFSDIEVETFRSNLCAGTLGSVDLAPKYVKERVFSADCDSNDVCILTDGCPRDAQRWGSVQGIRKAFLNT